MANEEEPWPNKLEDTPEVSAPSLRSIQTYRFQLGLKLKAGYQPNPFGKDASDILSRGANEVFMSKSIVAAAQLRSAPERCTSPIKLQAMGNKMWGQPAAPDPLLDDETGFDAEDVSYNAGRARTVGAHVRIQDDGSEEDDPECISSDDDSDSLSPAGSPFYTGTSLHASSFRMPSFRSGTAPMPAQAPDPCSLPSQQAPMYTLTPEVSGGSATSRGSSFRLRRDLDSALGNSADAPASVRWAARHDSVFCTSPIGVGPLDPSGCHSAPPVESTNGLAQSEPYHPRHGSQTAFIFSAEQPSITARDAPSSTFLTAAPQEQGGEEDDDRAATGPPSGPMSPAAAAHGMLSGSVLPSPSFTRARHRTLALLPTNAAGPRPWTPETKNRPAPLRTKSGILNGRISGPNSPITSPMSSPQVRSLDLDLSLLPVRPPSNLAAASGVQGATSPLGLRSPSGPVPHPRSAARVADSGDGRAVAAENGGAPATPRGTVSFMDRPYTRKPTRLARSLDMPRDQAAAVAAAAAAGNSGRAASAVGSFYPLAEGAQEEEEAVNMHADLEVSECDFVAPVPPPQRPLRGMSPGPNPDAGGNVALGLEGVGRYLLQRRALSMTAPKSAPGNTYGDPALEAKFAALRAAHPPSHEPPSPSWSPSKGLTALSPGAAAGALTAAAPSLRTPLPPLASAPTPRGGPEGSLSPNQLAAAEAARVIAGHRGGTPIMTARAPSSGSGLGPLSSPSPPLGTGGSAQRPGTGSSSCSSRSSGSRPGAPSTGFAAPGNPAAAGMWYATSSSKQPNTQPVRSSSAAIQEEPAAQEMQAEWSQRGTATARSPERPLGLMRGKLRNLFK